MSACSSSTSIQSLSLISHPRTHEIAGAFDRMLTGGSQVWELLSFVVDRLGVIVYVEAKQGHRMVSDW